MVTAEIARRLRALALPALAAAAVVCGCGSDPGDADGAVDAADRADASDCAAPRPSTWCHESYASACTDLVTEMVCVDGDWECPGSTIPEPDCGCFIGSTCAEPDAGAGEDGGRPDGG